MKKLLTIVIPIYNAENYLSVCLESIINEITEEVECILIDDGSTDSSSQIYQQYKLMDNITIVQQENHGVSYTRNRGIDLASGEYIMFVDADDYLKEEWLKNVLNELDESEYIIFSNKIKKNKYDKDDLLEGCLCVSDKEINNCQLMSPFSKIYKTEFLKSKNIVFQEDIINGEDTLFNFEVILKASMIKSVNKSIYIFRKNMFSSTNKFNPKIVNSEINFHNKLHQLINLQLNDRKWKEYEQELMLNGIYICFLSYSLSKSKGEIELLLNLIENNEEYKNILKSHCISDIKNIFKKIFFSLVKKGRYKLAILLLKMRNKIKQIVYSIQSEYILKEI